MRYLALLATLFIAAPALARGETVYKCKSTVFADQLSATLRLTEGENSGRIEIDYWNGYPPIGLVYADFKLGRTETDHKAYATESDRTSGYVAEFRLSPSKDSPGDLRLNVKIPKWHARKIFALDCQRF